MIMIIIINIVIPFQHSKRWGSCLGEESAASLHSTNNSNRRGKLMKYLCLYFALHIYFSLLYQRGTRLGEGAVCRREQEVMTFIIMIIMNILQQQGAAARDQGGDAQENVRPSWELEQVRH